MPANVVNYKDLRIQRWNGMMFRKFSPNPIRKLPTRLSSLALETPWACVHTLVDLISHDALALAMWEAL